MELISNSAGDNAVLSGPFGGSGGSAPVWGSSDEHWVRFSGERSRHMEMGREGQLD